MKITLTLISFLMGLTVATFLFLMDLLIFGIDYFQVHNFLMYSIIILTFTFIGRVIEITDKKEDDNQR